MPSCASDAASSFHGLTSAGDAPRVAAFGPHPLLSITIEARGPGRDDVHIHAAGQGLWVARVARELGAATTLCGFLGGETGAVLKPLLEHLVDVLKPVSVAGSTGCYVMDRRDGARRLVSQALSEAPSRHELDDLFSVTATAAMESDALAICNPYPGDALPLGVFGSLVADVAATGTPVLVDLSSPRLDSALAGGPAVVKLNDWELAEYVQGPVDTPERLHDAASRLVDAGAGSVIVTRGGEPALALRDGDAQWLIPPRLERGAREGCGDAMMGALAATIALGADWEAALRTGAAAGAANFMRHGLGSPSREAIESLEAMVQIQPFEGGWPIG